MDQKSAPDTLIRSPLDNLTVYVLHRDVDFEFGHVIAVFSTPEKAQKGLENALLERDLDTKELIYHPEELSIEEWTLDEFLLSPKN